MNSYFAPTRRNLVGGLIAAPSLLLSTTRGSLADTYPDKLVRFVCAWPAGSGLDIWVRRLVDHIRPLIGQPCIVENKPGAAGNIATEYVARSKPDGYTIYVQSASGIAANMFMLKNPPIDATKALINVSMLARFVFYLVVAADSPFKSLSDVVDHVRKKGNKASYGTGSSNSRLLGALLNEIMGLNAVEIQYRPGPEMANDLISGAVDYMFMDGVLARAFERGGRVRILASGGKERLQMDGDLPTMIESGVPGLYAPGSFGILVPVGTPRPVMEKINAWANEALKVPAAIEFIRSTGGEPMTVSVDEAQSMFLQTTDEWRELVKRSKIEPQG